MFTEEYLLRFTCGLLDLDAAERRWHGVTSGGAPRPPYHTVILVIYPSVGEVGGKRGGG